MTTLAPGDRVLWLYTAPYGWNASWWVPATIVRVTPKRVVIDAKRNDGAVKRVSVKPERVKREGE